MAVLSAIITAPVKCTVDIYTDSQNVINTYNYININNVLKYPRECLKTQHIDLWYALFDIVLHNELALTFHKIKAYANNTFNNQVDLLAKDALSCEPMTINIINSLYNVAPKFSNTVITTHVRKFIKSLTTIDSFFEFFNLRRNAKYRQLNIDWISTFEYINADSPTTTTTLNLPTSNQRRLN